MDDMRLTNEKIKAYDGEKGVFKTGAALEKFGEKQNSVNELLALNINDLIKRVCALEDQQIKNVEIMQKLAAEVSALRTEVDRLKLTAKLNTNAIERLARPESSAADGE